MIYCTFVNQDWKKKCKPNMTIPIPKGTNVEAMVVRNRTLTLIEREDDTRSWGNFLIYLSHSTTMSCPLRGWRYILICC
jgi:hypothetical protein